MRRYIRQKKTIIVTKPRTNQINTVTPYKGIINVRCYIIITKEFGTSHRKKCITKITIREFGNYLYPILGRMLLEKNTMLQSQNKTIGFRKSGLYITNIIFGIFKINT